MPQINIKEPSQDWMPAFDLSELITKHAKEKKQILEAYYKQFH